MRFWCVCVFLALVLVSTPRAAHGQAPEIYSGFLQRYNDTGCVLFRFSDSDDGSVLLQDYGEFQAGDTVTVIISGWDTAECGGTQFGRLLDDRIGRWRDFDWGCGTLIIDDEYGCMHFLTQEFGTLSLWGHLSGFTSGESVHVRGAMYLDPCYPIPECYGYPCVNNNAVMECETPVRSLSWGKLKSIYH